MKKIVLLLLPAFILPTSLNAESYWLLLRYIPNQSDGGAALEKIEMESMDQCELMGGVWASNKILRGEDKYGTTFGFNCLKGK